MTEFEFKSFVNDFCKELKKLAPFDTGNLAINAIDFVYIGPDKAEIHVNEDIAPYMPYTNEPWISPHWNGKRNPNQDWWQISIDFIVRKLALKYGGKII